MSEGSLGSALQMLLVVVVESGLVDECVGSSGPKLGVVVMLEGGSEGCVGECV